MTKSKLFKWLKNPLKPWKEKRARDKKIQEIEAKQQAKEDNQRIEKEAYLLWEADGRLEGKDNYYWTLAENKIKGKDLPVIYQPYYLLEKRILEPVDAWISRQAFFTILGRLGNLALIAAVIAFVFGENVRRNNEVFSAWQTITSANGQTGSGGRIEALQFLNSRPWRFPWIGWTEESLYWDEREGKCKLKHLLGLRWERQPLVGLSAPEAYLAFVHLCEAHLLSANLQEANLEEAKLQKANLREANLQEAVLLSANLQEAVLVGANLQEANLEEAKLQKANLGDANLQKARLSLAKLQEANLGDANLQEAWLRLADLQEAVLLSVNLQEAWLALANLQEAVLIEANLQEAVLLSVNLQETVLFSANLQETDLREANLQEAVLVEAKKLTNQQIKSACNWEKGIYKGKWSNEKQLVETTEPDNTNFIEELKKDKSSDPKEAPDCSIWDNKE